MPPLLKSLACLVILSLPLAAQSAAPASPAPDPLPKNPKDILALISATHQLHADGIKPWHLKASFQLYDDKGNPTDKGTLEEFFAGDHRNKRIIISPHFSQTEISNQDGDFIEGDTGSMPFFLRLAYEELLNPSPDAKDLAHTSLIKSTRTFGQTKLTCVMLDQPMKSHEAAPLGLFPTYCFDPDAPVLRAFYSLGSTFVGFNKIGRFLNNDIATSLNVYSDGHLALYLQVDALKTIPEIDPALLVASPNAINSSFALVPVGETLMAGSVISKVPPRYPDSAKAAHISGEVHLRALIATDGRIRDLRVIDTPSVDLALASLRAVRFWTYKPYTLNGKPVEVDTTITIHFNFGF